MRGKKKKTRKQACVSAHRELTPGGPGPGLRQGHKRNLFQLPLWLYIYKRQPLGNVFLA
jgi:hypothetical protein